MENVLADSPAPHGFKLQDLRKIMLGRLYQLVVMCAILAPGYCLAADAVKDRPFGIDKRIPWTTSRVIGSPDPPLPYRAVQIWPQLSLTRPIYLLREPGRQCMLLVEQLSDRIKGRIRRIEFGSDAKTAETILELDRLIYGLTFHPDFATNRYVFIFSNRKGDGKTSLDRVSRFTMERTTPFRLRADSELPILEWPSNGHDGGDLGFGPDGFLYIPTGDGTSDSDGDLSGQSMNDLLGAMLRIDVDHPSGGKAYSVPRDNPFVGLPGARPEIWAYGFRNPWRMTFDPRNGQLWVGNNGQDLWEQVFLVRRGDNFGWSVFEGNHPFQLERKLGPTPHVPPAAEHHHSEARSLTGGVVYYGTKFPGLQGTYIYGDYSTGRIWGLRHDGRRATLHRELADTQLAITGFAIDPDGELLVIDYGGGIYRLEPLPAEKKPAKFPTRLSETGLFRSVADARPDPALVPYSVNAPLWSDGAWKDRWIALPGASQIEFTAKHGWKFPEGAVLVKTFSLECEAGKPASRRRVETRLLTRQQGEWQGYSYQWNDQQTDATLVASAGMDRAFTIQDSQSPGGRREQVWHYPSRAECLVCHSRAVNFVLGLNTWQMNQSHDYGAVRDNQLRTLDHIGLFRAAKPGASALAKRPDEYPHLVDPQDAKQNLDARVRSYLHANCASCHTMAGGGNARLELVFDVELAKTNMLDALPQHHTYGIVDARIIAPGSPRRSILLERVNRRGPGQMPPLATSLVDTQAVELLRAWIEQVSSEQPGTK
jgi:uncharacterized repeat protein (TIGR03806 family)